MTGVSTVSFLKELEELAAKLAPASAAPGAAVPRPVSHHEWELVVENLDTAEAHFQDAAKALREAADRSGAGNSALHRKDQTTDPGRASVLAEVAVDLARETSDLRRRAEIRRKLTPERKASTAQPTAAAENAAQGDAAPSAHKPHKTAASTSRAAADTPEKAKMHGIRWSVGALDDAQASLAVAMKHASTGSGDAAATAFVEELDVLEEMTLGLRRRVDEISEVPVD